MEEDSQFDCKEFFRIYEYITIAIAVEHKYTLVTFETVMSVFVVFCDGDKRNRPADLLNAMGSMVYTK